MIIAFEPRPVFSGTIIVNSRGFRSLERRVDRHNKPLLDSNHFGLSAVNQSLIVTGTRAKRCLSDVPLERHSLTRRGRPAIPALTLDDTLRQIPGFSLFSPLQQPHLQIPQRKECHCAVAPAVQPRSGFSGWNSTQRSVRCLGLLGSLAPRSISASEVCPGSLLHSLRQRCPRGVDPVLHGTPEPSAARSKLPTEPEISPELPFWEAHKKDGNPVRSARFFQHRRYPSFPKISAAASISGRRYRFHRRSHGRPNIGQDSLIFARSVLHETAATHFPSRSTPHESVKRRARRQSQSGCQPVRCPSRLRRGRSNNQTFSSVATGSKQRIAAPTCKGEKVSLPVILATVWSRACWESQNAGSGVTITRKSPQQRSDFQFRQHSADTSQAPPEYVSESSARI